MEEANDLAAQQYHNQQIMIFKQQWGTFKKHSAFLLALICLNRFLSPRFVLNLNRLIVWHGRFNWVIIVNRLFGFNMAELTIGGGLNNLGNTCFFNATLQTILHTPSLSTFFASRRHSQNCPSRQSKQWCVFCEMESIYTNTRGNKRFSPNSMINHLKSIFKKFKLGKQEDSHQFLRYLIEGMQESETGKLGKDRAANEVAIKKTKVFEIFGGVMKTCVECLGCGFQSITCERYYDFNIRKECQRSNSLLEGIGSFFAVEKLEGANKYLCEKCKVRSNATKRFVLDSVPKVVTFQLKRFTNSMRKIGKFIQYPLTIDLGKHLESAHKVVLKLYAIVVHAGGSSYSGHYYAFVRLGESWYKMDDGYVSKISPESAMNQHAYLLFYEKVFEQLQRKQQATENGKAVTAKNVSESKQTEIVINNIIKAEVLAVQNHQIKQIHANGINVKSGGINGILIDKSAKQTVEIVNKQVEVNKQQEQSSSEEDEELAVPLTLKRRKSKQEMQRSLPYQELIMRTVQKILDINSKLTRKRPHNTSQRHMYDLRKYECVMQKKRKLG